MNNLIVNYGLCIAISTTLSYWIYKFLYNIFPCENLTELLVGSTIYANYNKLIDFAIFFIYVAIFFMIFPLIKKLLPITYFKDLIKTPKKFEFKGNKQILAIVQILCSFMYFLLYPNNGNTYPVLLFVIIFLVVLTNYDIYKRQKQKNNYISPFAVAPLALFIFGQSYNFKTVSIDDYHIGERLSTYYFYLTHHFEFFKDIILVHGLNDIFAGWTATTVFGENTLYANLLADTLIYNLNLLISFFLGIFVFSKAPILVSGIFISPFSYFNVYFLIGLSMLKKELLNKPFLWLLIYTLLAFLLPLFWTQIGTFLVIALLPVAIFMLWQLFKTARYGKIAYVAIIGFTIFMLAKSYIIANFNYLITNNIITSSNGFPQLQYHQIWSNFIKLFAILSIPCFVLENIKAFKQKNVQLVFIYAFAIIFPLIGLTYELSRIDYIMFSRIRFISIAYIAILLPFIFTITKSVWLKYSKYVFTVILIVLISMSSKTFGKWNNQPLPEKNKISTIGNLTLEETQQNRIENLKKVVDKYSVKDDYILDLTNRGLNYFYLERKIPYQYISFFNFTSEKQEHIALEKLKQNPPKIIIVKSENIQHDKVYPSLRINSIYRWILANNYKLLKDNQNVFLIKSSTPVKYTEKELEMLDNILSNDDLKKLPESWGNSVNSLNLKTGKDLMYFEIKAQEPVGLKVSMKNSNSELKFNASKNAKILIPLDNFPSWTIKPTEPIISADKPIEISNIKYLKRY